MNTLFIVCLAIAVGIVVGIGISCYYLRDTWHEYKELKARNDLCRKRMASQYSYRVELLKKESEAIMKHCTLAGPDEYHVKGAYRPNTTKYPMGRGEE